MTPRDRFRSTSMRVIAHCCWLGLIRMQRLVPRSPAVRRIRAPREYRVLTQYRVIAASFNMCQLCVFLVSSADGNGSTIALNPLDVMSALNTSFVAIVSTLLTHY